jgi:hypothetical protein
MEKKQLIVCLGAALLVSLPWQAQAQVQVFHSVQSANLPTADPRDASEPAKSAAMVVRHNP